MNAKLGEFAESFLIRLGASVQRCLNLLEILQDRRQRDRRRTTADEDDSRQPYRRCNPFEPRNSHTNWMHVARVRFTIERLWPTDKAIVFCG